MIERLRIMALPVLVAVAALFAGLEPTLLRTGRLIPLDWLVPELLALAAMILVASRGGRRPGWGRLAVFLMLALLPPLLLAVFAGTSLAVEALLALAILLALSALLLRWGSRRGALIRWAMPLLLLVLFVPLQLMHQRMEVVATMAATPRVGVMTALPLFRAHGTGDGLLDVGGRAPIVLAAQTWIEPLDNLDATALKPFDRLLLAQPRLLRPEELVVLDNWVRAGGQVVILADPLLRWPDHYPVGDPRRAPLTSLLDPLLTHWGLVLEPAGITGDEATQRHVLTGGGIITLAAASRFTLDKHAPCSLEEDGLIARCRIGKGRATLVADADWLDDRLWTLDPAHPLEGALWTSDAAPFLRHLLQGDVAAFEPRWPWLKSQDGLATALLWPLRLILLLGILLAFQGPIPISTHDPPRSKADREGDSGSVFPNSVT